MITDEHGSAVGQVRFDLQADGTAETDVSIAREHRARGVGSEALQLACAALADLGRAQRIVAKIRSGNTASQRVFEKGGFVFQDKQAMGGMEVVIMGREGRGRC